MSSFFKTFLVGWAEIKIRKNHISGNYQKIKLSNNQLNKVLSENSFSIRWGIKQSLYYLTMLYSKNQQEKFQVGLVLEKIEIFNF